MAHVQALRFLWNICHTAWFAPGARGLLQSNSPSLQLVSTNIKILARYRTILQRYRFSWHDVFNAQNSAQWNRDVQSRIAEKVYLWVIEEADRVSMPHLKALVTPQSIKLAGTAPLPPYLSFEASLSRTALQFRSDRVRFLRDKSPTEIHCQWCGRAGGENGRHFATCNSLPDALYDYRLSVEIDCEDEVPENQVKATLSFDYAPQGGLSDKLVKRIVVFQRQVLRSYLRQWFGIRPS
jgi:hypothetical protein